jgi:hypothetical protein
MLAISRGPTASVISILGSYRRCAECHARFHWSSFSSYTGRNSREHIYTQLSLLCVERRNETIHNHQLPDPFARGYWIIFMNPFLSARCNFCLCENCFRTASPSLQLSCNHFTMTTSSQPLCKLLVVSRLLSFHSATLQPSCNHQPWQPPGNEFPTFLRQHTIFSQPICTLPATIQTPQLFLLPPDNGNLHATTLQPSCNNSTVETMMRPLCRLLATTRPLQPPSNPSPR